MMCMAMTPAKLYFLPNLPSSPLKNTRRFLLKPVHCAPIPPIQQQVDAGIMCEPCNGKGWLICDFCKGVKTNVKAENNRIYRRCPSCRAIGYILCSKCKVFKCVTFPNYNDGADLSF
ncbi:chaperone protein dnaJ-related [Fagus crenata]